MRNTQGTNDAFGAQKGFLGYATHFQGHSVLKTGTTVRKGYSVPETPSYGTE